MGKPSPDEYLSVLLGLPRQIEDAYPLGEGISFGGVNKIVFAGMGGSGISGDLLKTYLHGRMYVSVVKDYEPDFVDDKTLFIAESYSGNTAETLSATRIALRKHAKVLTVTSGGALKELSRHYRTACVDIPRGFQPRAAIAYLFLPLLRVLENSGILTPQSKEVKKASASLHRENFAEKAYLLAMNLSGKIPLLYASRKYYPVAYRWKTQINENAKIHAFSHLIPEMCHNELVGYTLPKALYYSIFLTSAEEEESIKARVKATRELIAGMGTATNVIHLKGESFLARLFSAIHLGDLTSYYLAKHYKASPTDIHVIEELKKRLKGR